MRPIKLTLKNFGAFVKKTEIDFETLSKDGVFLITGETGSGKTTIFDAICYALYGKANGFEREARNFRSQYAPPDQNASVDLTFECDNKVYSIHREPPYIKGVVLPDGSVKYNKTETNAVVELHLPNGTSQTGNDVNTTIKEVIGLNCDQFRQVVMLAQGEFKRFLLAKSEDKGKILGTIFGTEKYDRFLEIFKEYADKHKDNYLKSLNAVVGDVMSFSYDDTWDYAEDFNVWKKLPLENKDVEIVLPYLKNYIDTLSEEKLTLESILNETIQKVNKLSDEVSFHENVNASIKARERLVIELGILTSQKDDIDAINYILNRLEDAMSVREDYQNCANASRKYKDLTNQLENIDTSIANLEKRIDNIRLQRLNALIDIPYEATNPENMLEELINLVNSLIDELSEINNKSTQVENIINSISNYERELSKLKSQQAELGNRINKKSRLEKEYSERERLYNLSIAGILAENLEEGIPCMVCGSTHHPHLATKLTEAPSKGQLEFLKQELESYQKQFINYQTEVLLHNERVEGLKAQILESATKLGISAQSVSEVKANLNILKESIEIDTIATQSAVNDFNSYIDTLKVLDAELSRLDYQLNGLKSSRNTIAKQIYIATGEYEDLKKVYFKSLEDRNLTQREYAELVNRQNEYQPLLRQVRDYENRLQDYTSRISEYSKAIGDNSYLDTTELSNALAVESKKYQLALNRHTNVTYILNNNIKVYNTVSKDIKGVLEKYQKYKDTERLYKFAKGTITNETNKVAFNNYVQAYYFDMVLASANEKIKVMSSGRYSLVNSNKANKRSGLDISVFDIYTGTFRSASTLSGGETFMASLSLALGLSEVVQQLSGGVKIDAMFIDEGFGTLDSGQSLQHAIEVIKGLSTNNRMVGIISHVSELQECIPNKLKVVKSKEGSEILINN